MKLVFIGTGSAFITGGNYQSNIILESSTGGKLLFDCGSDARHALFDLGLSHGDISGVYISHLHSDHVGGLEWLGFSSKFDKNRVKKPSLYISSELTNTIWDNCLSGGMKSLKGIKSELSTYFDVTSVEEEKFFIWENIKFHLIEMQHVMDFDKNVPCFGLFFEVNNKKIFITADTKFSLDNKINQIYKSADLIFHDCETSSNKSGAHAHFEELITLPTEIKEKIWLYHYNSEPLPNAEKYGFRGFITKGQLFDLTLTQTFTSSKNIEQYLSLSNSKFQIFSPQVKNRQLVEHDYSSDFIINPPNLIEQNNNNKKESEKTQKSEHNAFKPNKSFKDFYTTSGMFKDYEKKKIYKKDTPNNSHEERKNLRKSWP